MSATYSMVLSNLTENYMFNHWLIQESFIFMAAWCGPDYPPPPCLFFFSYPGWQDITLVGQARANRGQEVQYGSYMLTAVLYVPIVEAFTVGVGQYDYIVVLAIHLHCLSFEKAYTEYKISVHLPLVCFISVLSTHWLNLCLLDYFRTTSWFGQSIHIARIPIHTHWASSRHLHIT